MSAPTSLVVALSLLAQLTFLPYHLALTAPGSGGHDATRIAAALKAIFGDAAALCAQSSENGVPVAPVSHSREECPCCRFAAEAANLIAPDLPTLPIRLDEGRASAAPATDGAFARSGRGWLRQARAPPAAV